MRLGAAICEPHIGSCGARIDASGSHGLSCSLGFGRIARHSTISNIIYRSLSKARIPSIKEPPGLLRTDGRRPLHAGRHLVRDATVVDTLASSYMYVQATAAMAGAAAEIATERRNAKYSALLNTRVFVPLASGHFYSAPSSPLLFRGAPDYSTDTVYRSFTPKRTGNCI